MTPDSSKITIEDNLNKIRQFIDEIIVYPKQRLHQWATITAQSPAAKIGYIGQHLASLITGVKGTRTGARGDDLADGSEVKSCNKIDQVDTCKDCGNRVMRFEDKCPFCGSIKINRKEDSKWLFSVRDEQELNQYLEMDRIVLLLMDYPNFDSGDFKDIRISTFEIYPNEERMSVFRELISNHFYNIYMPKLDANEKTNPMNLHPLSFQFYKCNPILTFSCIIKNIETDPEILIDEDKYIRPDVVRDSSLQTIPMPSDLLMPKKNEWQALLDAADFDSEIRPLLKYDLTKEQFASLNDKLKVKALPYLDEKLRNYIPLRDIISVRQANHYQRR